MVIPNSWFDDSDNTSRTPPDEIFRYAPRRLDKVRRSLYAENDDCQNEDPLLDCSVVSSEVASDEVVKDMSTSDEVAKEMSTIDDVAKEMSIIDDVTNEMNTSDEEQETHVNDISCVNTKIFREDQCEEFQAQVIMVRVVCSLFLALTIAPGSLTILLNNALETRYWHPVVYFSAIFFNIMFTMEA
jgi:centromeric protein E